MQKMIELQKIDKHSYSHRLLHTSKGVRHLNTAANQLYIIDIQAILHSWAGEHTSFLRVHESWTKTSQSMKIFQVIQSLSSDQHRYYLEIKRRNISGNISKYWEQNNILNSSWSQKQLWGKLSWRRRTIEPTGWGDREGRRAWLPCAEAWVCSPAPQQVWQTKPSFVGSV